MNAVFVHMGTGNTHVLFANYVGVVSVEPLFPLKIFKVLRAMVVYKLSVVVSLKGN